MIVKKDQKSWYRENKKIVPLPGGQLASASFDDTIKIWQTETGQKLQNRTGHLGIVNAFVGLAVRRPAGQRQLRSDSPRLLAAGSYIYSRQKTLIQALIFFSWQGLQRIINWADYDRLFPHILSILLSPSFSLSTLLDFCDALASFSLFLLVLAILK